MGFTQGPYFQRVCNACPLSVIVIFLGVYPAAMLNLMNASVNAMVKFMAHAQTIYSQFASF
jgi:NADH:ubiquinone oxidoreductase subunit 4 (subunit M)